MKLLQLNVWAGRLESQIASFLQEQQADILCLQEVISRHGKGSGLFISLENIQEQNPELEALAFGPSFSFPYMRSTARFGNAVLSQFPMIKSEIVFTNMEHKDDFEWGEDSANMRNFVHAVLDVNDTKCHVITHHGFHVPDHKDGNAETLRQMKQLTEYVGELDGPVIVTGDFNLKPESKSIQILNKILRNLTLEAGLKTTRTELTNKTEACDFIFVNDLVKVKKFAALDDIVSDHKALLLEFNI